MAEPKARGELFNKTYNKMKHDLEAWREAILLADTILCWEAPLFAGLIGGAVTLAYIVVWYMDLSLVTLVSLLAIGAVVLDYAYPIVARMVFKPDQWTGKQEKRYEQVVEQLCAWRLGACQACQLVFVGREEKSTKHYLYAVLTLIAFAYLGAVIDNLFLCYLTSVVLALWPGLQHNGYVQLAQTKVCALVGTHVQNIKAKLAGSGGGGSGATANAATAGGVNGADKKAE